jgi:hypothetical protein
MKFKTIFIMIGSFGIVTLIAVLFFKGSSVSISNELPVSQTALAFDKDCNTTTRPLAVMVSSDPEARPLSGIGQADIVFEMPVTPTGITRMMTVFQCTQPKEIGSIRSARLDFVPLALGLNALYAHWGGEHTVLEELDNGIIDNLNGLQYDGIYFTRKSGIPAPHNGFATFASLGDLIKKKNYKTTTSTPGYQFEMINKSQDIQDPLPVYTGHMAVSWKYNKDTNGYMRTRDNTQEIDNNTSKQVEVKNVIVMHTTQSPMSKDYIRVKTVGSGSIELYKNGQRIIGTWKKENDNAKLFFYDIQGKEIQFAPGSIWVEIVT